MKLKTDLISGAGNVFHIASSQAKTFLAHPDWRDKMKSASIEICRTDKADGFIFLEDSEASQTLDKTENLKWYFFNNDGSDAEMCGNATRCIGYLLKNKFHSPHNRWSLETVAGKIQIENIDGHQFKITMPKIRKQESELGFLCDTGVPHLVLDSPTIDLFKNLSSDLKTKAAFLRSHPSLGAKGSNVTFVELQKESRKIKAASFERGVEDFTEACGTGAVAAAYRNFILRGIVETEVEMPGGTLIINLADLDKPTMTGPAQYLGSFEYDIKT